VPVFSDHPAAWTLAWKIPAFFAVSMAGAFTYRTYRILRRRRSDASL
jgi:hypothetical protein